jgi:cell division protein FtsI (penicillin-binding protein 3)
MNQSHRLKLLVLSLYLLFSVVLGRLFYWQIIKGDTLQAAAVNQYQTVLTLPGSRGEILTADGHTLVGNQVVYRLFAEPKLLETTHPELIDQLLPILTPEIGDQQQATSAADLEIILKLEKEKLLARLEQRKDLSWVGLFPKISSSSKEIIENLKIAGLGFEPYQIRSYPEASMAAHLTGFVGKDKDGADLGYFGIEGALEKELQPRSTTHLFDRDILGFSFESDDQKLQPHNGRNVVLTIKRDLQYLVEDRLAKGVERFGAKSGEVIVYEPATGEIVAAAAYPKYDQKKFFEYEQELYKNPIVSHVFEPGSTFKVITMAAGIESEAITPDTVCDRCDGPVEIGKYTIKTWNDEYNADINMTDALVKSDNTAMVFAQEEMGIDTFKQFIKDFAIGQSTTQDLQEDAGTPFPKKFGAVETANMSFGQGVSTTSLQLVRAVGAIANHGQMMQPLLVKQVIDPVNDQEIIVEPQPLNQVISPQTATDVTKMMVTTADVYGKRWSPKSRYSVAGKTGTAQIAVDGQYDVNKTIASYIAFSPAQNPRYLMYVKLVEPTTSPWGSATAAPLWYGIADELNILLQVSPDR